MKFFKSALAVAAATLAVAAQASPIVTANTNATQLANTLAGSGITISNAVLTTNTTGGNGTFTNGNATVGFDSGVILTTGTLDCVGGPNNQTNCTGDGNSSELSFNFTSDTGQVFFQYVFASEEYNEFAPSGFNDSFELLLNGVNIAQLPGGAGPVTINNVNCFTNAQYYRNNNNSSGGSGSGPCPTTSPNLNLNIQYDGLTVILTASGNVSTGVLNSFVFRINDVGDSAFDSGVFIKAGSFSGTNPTPEPGSLALVGAALAGLAAARRRKA